MSTRKGSLLALRDREPAQIAPQIEQPLSLIHI